MKMTGGTLMMTMMMTVRPYMTLNLDMETDIMETFQTDWMKSASTIMIRWLPLGMIMMKKLEKIKMIIMTAVINTVPASDHDERQDEGSRDQGGHSNVYRSILAEGGTRVQWGLLCDGGYVTVT